MLVALWQRQRLSPYFALPIFIIWALLMVLIWMYLLGIATFFSGSFSPITYSQTRVKRRPSTSLRSSSSSPVISRIAGFVTFAAVQIAAPVEIVLTVLIGGFSAVGIAAWLPQPARFTLEEEDEQHYRYHADEKYD